MATTLKSLVALPSGEILTVADGLAAGQLVRVHYWDIQFDENAGSMLHRTPAWKFEHRCPQYRDETKARDRLAVYRRNRCGKTRLVRREFIDTPDHAYQYGQIGKAVPLDA